MQREKGCLHLSLYNAEVIAGQGTVGLEMFDAIPDLDTIVVAVVVGALIGGIGVVVRRST